jgi:multimeric flavodoxin WrbA
MKVTAFNGSPRKTGNTMILLENVLKPIEESGIEVDIVQVGGESIRGCAACGRCRENKNRRCVINSDIVNDCIAKMDESNAIIFGSPSYFACMTSEMKALVDRSGYVSAANDRMFSRKIGAAVSAHRRGGAVNVVDSINHMFLISRMIIPGSTYWNFGVGREEGDVESDREAMNNMRDLGESIAWLINKIG